MRFSVTRSLAILFSAAFIGISLSATARAEFGTGTDIYWAQSNGNATAAPAAANSSDPVGFSVDGLWDDTLSTGYASPHNVPAGTFPSINWSTSSAGTAVPATIPGTYPGTSPNATDPGYIPGSPGNTNVDVVFDAGDGNNSTSSILVNYSPTVLGIYITNPDKTTEIRTDTSSDPRTITVGSDGITIEPTVDTTPMQVAGSNISFGNANAPLTLAVNGSQTWANLTVNNTGVSAVQGVTFSGPVTVPGTITSPLTLTLSAPGDNPATGFPANNHLNGYISDNTAGGGVMAIDVTSGQWTFGASGAPPAGSSTYTGGLTVENGAQVRDIYLTGAGTGTVTVNSGGTFAPNTGNGSSIYANPIVINGTGDALAGVNSLTTYGAIHSMNTGAAASTNTDTLSGGITLDSNSLVEAQFSSLIIATNAVVLGSNTLTLAGAGGTDNISISISAPIQGLGGVTVNTTSGTAGTVTFSNANNTYSGTTTVATGTLALSTSGNNNIAGSALIQVNSGATFNVSGVTGSGAFGLASGQTLSGEGAVSGVLTVNASSHLDPGGPPGTIGTLNTNQVTLKPGAILDYEFGATSNDFLNLTSQNLVIGTPSIPSDIAVNLFQVGNPTAAFDTPGTYDLIGYTASITGEGVPALFVGNPQAGFSYVFGTDAAHSNDVDLTITAVPEPASLMLLAVGLGMLGWAQSRRRKVAAA